MNIGKCLTPHMNIEEDDSPLRIKEQEKQAKVVRPKQ